MTRRIFSLLDVADDYDAIVFDQWGVLHNGSTPYPKAQPTIHALNAKGTRMAVLSNSGKREAPNSARIGQMGFDPSHFEYVMTSGEALWRDMAAGLIPQTHFYAIERAAGDATDWSVGLDLVFCDTLAKADAILLMGLPDGMTLADWEPTLAQAATRNLPLFCSNPDLHSPRAGGFVVSPGTLAQAYAHMGQSVAYYGKPHRPVFKSLQSALGTDRLLMVGDSLGHDIKGAAGAGWDSLLIESGLLADETGDLTELLAKEGCPPPTYQIETLQ